jgi:hypothetical protein
MGSIIVHSIGVLMLIFVAGIQWLHALVSAWFMTCHEVKIFSWVLQVKKYGA